jgi:hypothetical protein
MQLEFNKTGLVSELHNTKQKATEELKKAIKFFEWFKKIGGDVANMKTETIFYPSEKKEQTSSFKSNPEATKQKFNHKFNLS